MDDKDLQYMREERQRAMNPSVYDKGFEEGDSSMNDDWGSSSDWGTDDGWGSSNDSTGDLWSQPSSGMDDNIWGTSPSSPNSMMDTGSFSSQYSSPFMPGGQSTQPNTQTQGDFEDKIFDGVVKGGKVVVNAVKESGKAAKTFGVYNARGMGKQLIITGGLCILLGFLTCVLKTSIWFHFVTGGLITVGVGVPLMMIAQDRIEKAGAPNEAPADTFTVSDNTSSNTQISQQVPQAPLPQQQAMQSDDGWGDWGMEESEPSNNTSSDMSWGEDTGTGDTMSEESSSENWGGWEDESEESTISSAVDDEDTENYTQTGNVEKSDEVQDNSALIDNIDLPRGVVTRQFIFEKVSRAFKHVTRDYAKTEDLDEDSKEFGMWLGILDEAVDTIKQSGDSREARPVLVKVRKKLFYYILEIDNKGVKGVKMEALKDAIVSLYAYDKETNKLNQNIYGTGNVVGNMFYIKIMRDASVSVSVADLLETNSDYFLDTKHELPCALGLDIDGDPVLVDIGKMDSLLITGAPRTGKSWAARNILIQMFTFGSPNDINFYIFDPKDGISDYVRLKVPHIRRFETKDEQIVEALREVVRVEGPRRKQMLKEAGVYKIQEFREKCPNVPFPFLYVLIDEVVSLAERMDKDTKNEFQGLLMELVTQLPAAGIRLIMLPHVVKDEIIKKTTTQNIPCRISVKGDANHIETCTGMKCGKGEGQFGYKLTKVGDMAVNISAGTDTVKTFVHSSIVGNSSEASDAAFDFVNALWRKIEDIPDDLELRVSKSGSLDIAGGSKYNNVQNVTVPQKQISLQKGQVKAVKETGEMQQGFSYTVENKGTTLDSSKKDTTDDFVDYDEDENIW